MVTLTTLLKPNVTPKIKIHSTGGSPAHLDSLNPLRKSVKVATVNLIADSIVKKPKPSTTSSSPLSSSISRKLVSSIRVVHSAVPSPDLLLFDDQESCLSKLKSVAKLLKLEFTSKYICGGPLIEIELCKIFERVF